MKKIQQTWDWLVLANVTPDLAVAQFGELQRQVPLLYALLSLNAVAVASTHYDVAPVSATVIVPALLVTASIIRMVSWLRKGGQAITAAHAIMQLRRTIVLAAILAVAYISWSLFLSRYGGDREQAHIAIFIAVTVIGCIFCLMPLPQAALVVTVIVMGPSLAHYVSRNDPIYAAIGVNIALVTVVMMRVLLNSHLGFVQVVQSRTETERLNREITLLAHTDPLTGLPNRRLFFDRLETAIEEASGAGQDFALGVIDLDRFKSVNDSMGHFFGDQLLEAVGNRLTEAFPPDGFISRLGGDEFAFQIAMNGDDAADLAARTCEYLSEPYRIGEVTVSVGASCGLATLASIRNGVGSLYDAADYALYVSKSERRGIVTQYSAAHEDRIRTERVIEAALQSADLESEMDVHFQPIMGGRDCTIVSVEALARWTSPLVGSIGPDVFIPLAERMGIVHRLTERLFRKAIRVLEDLPRDIKLSFNLSAHDLASSETILNLVSTIRQSGFSPSRFVFELTETAVMRDFAIAEKSILLLRAMGAQIALDDFGTGQSSLSYLRQLPIDKIKIDRSFINDAVSAEGRELLEAIIALSKKMRISCVAEGIETAEHLNILRALGCDAFQGYFFSRPVAADRIVDFARKADMSGAMEARQVAVFH